LEVIRNIAKLGRERGIQTLFLYLPALYVPVQPSRLKEAFHEAVGEPLIVPDKEVLAQFTEDTFVDGAHPNNLGRTILHDWLNSAIPDVIMENTAQ